MAYRSVRPRDDKEQVVTEGFYHDSPFDSQFSRVWWIEQSPSGTFIFHNWGHRERSGDTPILKGTFADLFPTWNSIVLMCIEHAARKPTDNELRI